MKLALTAAALTVVVVVLTYEFSLIQRLANGWTREQTAICMDLIRSKKVPFIRETTQSLSSWRYELRKTNIAYQLYCTMRK